MVALRSRRLEALFGSNLDSIASANVRALVDVNAEEMFDLDFKQSLYGRSDRERLDLAGDVAALANTAGGMIVLGIEEDEQSRAKSAPGVEVTDSESARIRQIVASLVSPMPVFDVVRVLDDPAGTGSHGFILIAVPRSPSAPHAVLVNNGLRYPKRNGSTTRYLSEPEVASAYRDRTFGAVQQLDRARSVARETVGNLDRSSAWLLVTVVPDLPGGLTISRESFDRFRSRTLGTQVAVVNVGRTYQRTRVGRRRFLADATRNESPLATHASLDLHADGAGAYALELRNILGSGADQWMVDDELIAIATISGLLQLGSHARDEAAAGGSALVQVRLVPPDGLPLVIGYSRDGFADGRSQIAVSGDLEPAETTAAIDDLASPGTELVASAAALIDELGQAFDIPEMGQLTQSGQIQGQYWSSAFRQPINSWAIENGISTEW